jgi:hypothetical protein
MPSRLGEPEICKGLFYFFKNADASAMAAFGGRLLSFHQRGVRVSFDYDRTQVTQERRTLQGTLHDYATAVHRVHLAASEIEFTEAVECSRDGGLGNVQVGRQAMHAVRAFL